MIITTVSTHTAPRAPCATEPAALTPNKLEASASSGAPYYISGRQRLKKTLEGATLRGWIRGRSIRVRKSVK